jgi:hypothetical protein
MNTSIELSNPTLVGISEFATNIYFGLTLSQKETFLNVFRAHVASWN